MKARNEARPARKPPKKQDLAKGQSSVELVLIITLALIISMMVLSRFMNVQESVFTAAAAREQLIGDIATLSTGYTLRGIATAECADSARINVTIKPSPEETGDDSFMTANITDAVKSTRNLGPKT